MGVNKVGVAACVLLVAAASTRQAEACHTGFEIAVAVGGLAEVGINTPLTIHDLVVDESSRGYGLGETIVKVPGVLIWAALAHESLQSCDENGGAPYPMATSGQKVFAFTMLGWSTALLAHGIYALARPRTRSQPNAVAIVPLASDRGELVGLGLGGAF